jgi:bacteriocin-like protein
MKANERENKTQSAPANELNENDLENVSGGLWGITILDTCRNSFEERVCMECFGEYCPQLVVNDQKYDYYQGNTKNEYVLTCKKGCFKNLKFSKSITY